MHLWETDHSYYCNEGNYYASFKDQPHQYYENIDDFLEEEGDADLDMNLVFRWDWTKEEEVITDKGVLKVFIMGQRKGLFRWVIVSVVDKDENKVREYLMPRLEHLKSLWSPLK